MSFSKKHHQVTQTFREQFQIRTIICLILNGTATILYW